MKILRSLPERFDMKVTAIEEAQNISCLMVDELIWSLQNFEININSKTDKNNNQSKDVQCHKCEGYGHIRTECTTYLKKQKKSLAVSWSDEDNWEGEVENEYAKNVTALTGVYMSDDESGDEELSYEELVISYKDPYTKSINICKVVEKQKKIISQLQTERDNHLAKISEINDEVTQINSQLEHLKKQVKMITTWTNALEEILEVQIRGKPNGIGFYHKAQNKKHQHKNFAYALKDYGKDKRNKKV